MGAIVFCFVEIVNTEQPEKEAELLAEFNIPRGRDFLALLGWRTPEGQIPFVKPKGLPSNPSWAFMQEYEDDDFVTWLTPKQLYSLYLSWIIKQPKGFRSLKIELLVDMVTMAKLPKPYQLRVVCKIES